MNTVVARRFQYILNLRGIKSKDLAERTGINKSSISQYLNGHNVPKSDRAEELAKVLNVSPAWLMGFNVQMNDDRIESHEYESHTINQSIMEVDKQIDSFEKWFFNDVIGYSEAIEIEELRQAQGDKMAKLALYSMLIQKLSGNDKGE